MITRLELLSALLLVQLLSTVTIALLKLGPPRWYTHSQVGLYWIQGRGKQGQSFVQNRVNEINKFTEKGSWGHCPEKEENPADLPSRRISPLELWVSVLWRCHSTWVVGQCTMEGRWETKHNCCLLRISSLVQEWSWNAKSSVLLKDSFELPLMLRL